MSKQVGFYPGSFDPVTNGHLDVIERACRLVDKLIVGVGVHHSKSPLTTIEERFELLQKTTGPIAARNNAELQLVTFEGLMVKAARDNGANIIIRGLRDTTDYNYEMQMVGMNAQMAPDQQTVFVPASPHVRHISATLVRQIAQMDGDITAFVPGAVVKLLSEK